jgi:hypothetical protein
MGRWNESIAIILTRVPKFKSSKKLPRWAMGGWMLAPSFEWTTIFSKKGKVNVF